MVVLSDVSNMFWGVTLDGGKRYTQTVEHGFHISMAALEVPQQKDGKDLYVSVMIHHDKAEFLLCTLHPTKMLQQPLDLNFTEGEEVTFFLNGKGVVHLTGYLNDDDMEQQDYGDMDDLEGMEEEEEDEDEEAGDSDEEEEEPPSLLDIGDEDSDSEDEEDDDYAPSAGKRRKQQAAGAKGAKKSKVVVEADSDDDEEDSEDLSDLDIDEDDFDEEGLEDDEDDDEDDGEDDEDDDEEEEEEEEEEEDGADIGASFIQTVKSKNHPVKEGGKKQQTPAKGEKTPGKEGAKEQKGNEKKTPNKAEKNGQTPGESDGEMSSQKKKKRKRKKKNKGAESPGDQSDQSQTATPAGGQKQDKSPKQQNKSPKQQDKTPKQQEKTPKQQDKTPKQQEKTPKQQEKTPKAAKQVLVGGVIAEEVKVGHGPTATPGKMVHVYYTGRLQNGKLFDSSTSGKPFKFKLGKSEVIKGWDAGLQGMKVGGKRKLVIPPKMGYGFDRAGSIPPNSTLVFDVELKAIS